MTSWLEPWQGTLCCVLGEDTHTAFFLTTQKYSTRHSRKLLKQPVSKSLAQDRFDIDIFGF